MGKTSAPWIMPCPTLMPRNLGRKTGPTGFLGARLAGGRKDQVFLGLWTFFKSKIWVARCKWQGELVQVWRFGEQGNSSISFFGMVSFSFEIESDSPKVRE